MARVLKPPSTPSLFRPVAGEEKFSSLPNEIIQTHILPRLDGATLVALGCVSTRFYSLCSSQHLWREICTATWPSIGDPRLRQIISSFASGYRSFFSDSFPLLHQPQSNGDSGDLTSTATRLISAVDIYYSGIAVFSQVQNTVTTTRWFKRSILRIDLFEPTETFPTAVTYDGEDEEFIDHLESTLTLSWIIIDPTRKRAVNVSSQRPVSVRRSVLRDVEMRFAAVVGEGVKCEIVVTCVRRKGREMHVRETWLQMVDMEGRQLNGRDSLVILEGVLGKGRRERGDGRERHREFETRQREWKERRERRRRALDVLGISSIVVLASALIAYHL